MELPINATPSQQTDFDLEFQEATDQKVKATLEGDELPEKYRDKSPKDIIEMHMNAEKRVSQLGNEVGQLRKLADQLLELKKDNVREPERQPPKPVTVDEIFSDPDSAIKKTFESSNVARKAEDAVSRVENIERAIALQSFESRYPSYKQDLSDPAFQEWVGGNLARAELFRRADGYDVASADALWQMWGEYKELKSLTEKREQAKEKRKEALTAAKTVQDSPLDTGAKAPVYSRAKLMELQTKATLGDISARTKWNDPGFQSELLKAYSEGRVR